MSRPTRFCAKCGEFVADKHVPVTGPNGRLVLKLVHIDADGNTIHRAHKPVEGEQ